MKRFCGPSLLLLLSVSGMASASSTSVSRRLSLTDLLDQTRRQHPLLVAARERVAIAEGDLFASGRRPNPALQFSVENLPVAPTQGDFRFTQYTDWFATYVHRFERGRKLKNRVALASTGVQLARLELGSLERRLLNRVAVAWEEVLASAARLKLARSNVDHFQQIVRFNEVRVSEGYTAAGDLIKAKLEAERLAYTQRALSLEHDRARIGLLQATGSSTFDIAFEVDEEIRFEPLALNAVDLKAAALARPEIRIAEELVRAAEASLRLEQSRAKQDLTTTVGYKRNGPDNTLIAGVSVPLPFFDKNRGAITRSQAAVREAKAQILAQRSVVLAELAAARRAVEAAADQFRSVQARYLSFADESNGVALAAYREGAQDFLYLLEAQRARNLAQELILTSMANYRLAVRELEAAAGLDRIPRADETPPAVPASSPAPSKRDASLQRRIQPIKGVAWTIPVEGEMWR